MFLHIVTDVKAAAVTLGYTKKLWDGDKEPALSDYDYDDLTTEQKAAAAVFGYDKKKVRSDICFIHLLPFLWS